MGQIPVSYTRLMKGFRESNIVLEPMRERPAFQD